ncbi:MAG: hypothetical protein K8R77_11655 [Anaerolineaceae bacterium]|nr:hypothetical protein [Anaerolineaceae bacterium]
MENAIVIDHLKRIYTPRMGVFRRTTKKIIAVDDISFNVKTVSCLGFWAYWRW